MIEQMTGALVNKMEKEQMISKERKEQYNYALITLIEKWLTIITIGVASVINQNILPTFFFLFIFFTLRSRTGGYHADKFYQCYILTVLTYFAVTWLSPILAGYITPLYLLVLISAGIVLALGTVNHPNMDMDQEELAESKRTARWLVVLYAGLILGLLSLGANHLYLTYMSIGVILCAILMVIAKLINQEVVQ